MGIWDTITDLVEAATPWAVAEAEAPVAKETTEETTAETTEESKAATAEEPAAGEEPEAEAEEDEDEDEDEDEIVDPKETLEEECRNSKQCATAKHHFDECVERVTAAQSEDKTGEDCVEEFFHLAHCATQCAAPKLWSVLK